MKRGKNIFIGRKTTTKRVAGLAIAGLSVASTIAIASSILGSNIWSPKSLQVHGSNTVVMHNHVQLEIRVDGTSVVVPANIGISPSLYRDHSLDQFGVMNPPMAPLHTHDSDGLIHIESTVMRDYTLGQFLDISGLKLETAKSVAITVDGNSVPDYKNQILKDGEKIVLSISS